jgi:bifunctional enzyme CysN/CysC
VADSGQVAVVSLISPYAADRARARAVHEDAGLPFVEVFVNTPLEECERRDPKGLYARARAGEVPQFTGVSDPYEPPEHPDLEWRPEDGSVADAVDAVLRVLAGEAAPATPLRRSR